MSKGLSNQPIAAVPVYFWRGARPFPFELTPAETGLSTLLVLGREGEVCLLPLTWDRNVDATNAHLTLPLHAHALDRDAFKRTLHDLRADGWEVNGRVDVRYAGEYTVEQFWPTIEALLWQSPGEHDGADDGNPVSD